MSVIPSVELKAELLLSSASLLKACWLHDSAPVAYFHLILFLSILL